MSQQLDRDVVRHHALVVDANPTSRSVLMQNLRTFGFESVKQASRIIEARELLEHRRFDVVICDDHFDNGHASGQDFLEELRREQMLPYSTVFVMVTAEATYAKVAEAAEAALDSYLVKPFSAGTLFERVKEARQRKRVLKDIFEAMEAKDFDLAAKRCLARFEQKQQYWLYAARIGAEILLSLKRHGEAKGLYDAVIAAKTVPWARLGVARAQLADGDAVQARRTLESLMAEEPAYADSYDVMGKVQMEQGQLAQALQTYRTAAELTPGCILRLQHCGTLSFYAGDTVTASSMLERTWQQGSKSRLFDVLSMMLLAFLRFDAQDSKGLDLSYDVLMRFSEKYPQSVRLRRMAELGTVLSYLQNQQPRQAMQLAQKQVEERHRPDFDMEAATNTLSLWARSDKLGLAGEDYPSVVRHMAKRFCVSKASTEVLCAAVQHQARAEVWIREAHAEVQQMAQAAMNHALAGQPTVAVQTLLAHGNTTGNAKLIDLASAVAQRHSERIDSVDTLLQTAATLAHRFCAPATHIAGVRRSNRSAGGLVLRR